MRITFLEVWLKLRPVSLFSWRLDSQKPAHLDTVSGSFLPGLFLVGCFSWAVPRVWDAKGVAMVIDHYYVRIYRRRCFRLAEGGKVRADEICRACAGSCGTKLVVCGSCDGISTKITTLPPLLPSMPWYHGLAYVPSRLIKPVYVLWFHPYYNSK
jgi:hypothetical protein